MFAPIVAGTAQMRQGRFAVFNLTGAFVWVVGLKMAGYVLGEVMGETLDRWADLAPVQPGQVLAARRLAVSGLVGRRCDGARSDAGSQDLELTPGRPLANRDSHQTFLATANRGSGVVRVRCSSTNRGRDRRWVKLARPLSPPPPLHSRPAFLIDVGPRGASHSSWSESRSDG